MKKRWICGVLTMWLMLVGCTRQQTPAKPLGESSVEMMRAVRATWIPYMEAEQLLASEDPAQAIRACVRDCAARGINTVYFHVRANSDAYYASSVYPPTASTTASGIDPLAVAIEEAHRLGLELHAWINPYRIGKDASRAQTQDVFCFEDRWYYIPTAESTHRLILDGVRELLEHYAIDGIQFDDYFYPVGAVEETVPASFEQATFASYTAAGGTLSVADWRRTAVSRLIGAVYAACHTREGCVFGVSPASDVQKVRGQMYADVALWADTAGYVDYLCPQIYFGFLHQTSPFLQELEMWSAMERHPSVSLVAGLALYKTGLSEDAYAGSGKTEWASGGEILARQVRAVIAAQWSGVALYSHLSFEADETRDAAVVQAETAALSAEFQADKK